MNKELPAGSTLSHYSIVSKIGAGGMGEVYLAQDTSELGRTVALKILPAEVAKDKDRLRRFTQEARTVSNLNHPNILTVYEFGQTDSACFIATEYVDGVTLRDHLSNRRSKLIDVLDVAIQIVAALNAAHEAGVTHRDLKPENVMVRKDHIVKVLDFGLAKLSEPPAVAAGFTEAESSEEAATKVLVKTEPGLVMGTVSYMSPEQSLGQGVDQRTDIWSAGVVLYEMIAGSIPFPGKDIHRQIIAIQETAPLPLAQQVEGVPERLEEIVLKCLAKERDERYQTAKDLLIDLRNLRRKLDVDAEIERTVAPALRSTSAGASPNTQGAQMNADVTASAAQVSTTSSAQYIVTRIKQHRLAAVLSLVVIVTGITAFTTLYLQGRPSNAAIKSIAVMPFVNEGGNADLEYLSDGMTDTLISSLSQLPNLNVKARSSVFRYKGKEVDAKTVGKELGVQAILNGRFLQRGDQLTLTLELIDASTENILWSEQYNRQQADLVTLQSEIARDVSSKLKTRLSGADEAKVAKKYTANPEAYQLYLKGRFYWNKRTIHSLKQAVEFYRQAIEKDPNYALAYSGLAEAYVLFASYSVASAKDSMPQAKAAALRALELDDSLAEAHTALGSYLNYFEWNRDASEKEFRRAIELNPNYATARQWLGSDNLVQRKRFDEALVSLRRAGELDPLSSIISMNIGFTLYCARRYDEAMAQINRALALDQNFQAAHASLGWTYHAKGMYREAMAEYRKATELGDDPLIRGFLALSLAKSGQRDEATNLLNQLKLESTQRYVPSYAFAITYIGLNEKEQAFVWLEKEIEERGYWANMYAVAPELDELRDDPRYKAMLKRLNLPE